MNTEIVLMGHGGGGMLTRRLIDEVFRRALGNPILDAMDDSAVIEGFGGERRVAFTTDSYVVRPLEFPGGDIGRLAVCGTVNDLAMQGAIPRFLSLGVILEEGLPFDVLRRIAASIGEAAREAGVLIATGDTKVVERGKADGVFINTAGIGEIPRGIDVSVGNARPGDVVLVTGFLGDHGVAVLSRREGIAFETELESDVAPLGALIRNLLTEVPEVRCLRDPTRGGLAGALHDIAEASRAGIRIREESLPVRPPVRGACRLLGLDPIALANEGKAVVVLPPDAAPRALALLREDPLGGDAVEIGVVTDEEPGIVLLETTAGGERIVELPAGEDLPRIC